MLFRQDGHQELNIAIASYNRFPALPGCQYHLHDAVDYVLDRLKIALGPGEGIASMR
jgi:hypothetical protein